MLTQTATLRNYVGGQWTAASATQTTPVRNPAPRRIGARVMPLARW